MKFSNHILTVSAKALPLCIAVAFTTLPQAEASTWVGGIQANWFNAANWSPAGVPSPGHVAIINTGVAEITTGGIARDIQQLQVGNIGSATFALSNGGRLSTGNANIGNSAGGWGLVVVTGVDSDGTRAFWSNHSVIQVGKMGTGILAIQDGGKISTETIEVGTGGGSLSVSGFHPDGTRSELSASYMATINGNLDVANGGLLNSYGTEIRGTAIVTGAHANGVSSTLEAKSFLGVYGNLQVLDGGAVNSDNVEVIGGATISGISAGGTRATMTSRFLKTKGGANGNGLDILGGGLVISDSADFRLHTTVSGVSAGGTSSTLQVAGMRIRESGKLSVIDGAQVEVTYPSSFDSSGEIIVSGVSAEGKHSILKVNGSLGLREGSLIVRDGGVIESGGIYNLINGRPSVTFDGGIFRSTTSGKYFENIRPGKIQFLGEGLQFDTQLNTNTIGQRLGGSGGLVKLGAGTLEIITGNVYEGDTIVSEGLLLLNNKTGSATGSGDVRVLSNATLGGGGSISGSLINNGTVSPGNSPGTLTIAGDFQQNSGGKLLMEIASQDEFDILSVGGTVTLGGVLEIKNDTPLKYGKFDIIQTDSEISGAFDSIFFTNPQDGRIRSVTNGGTLTLGIAPTTYAAVAATPNETSLAGALSAWIDDTSGDTLTIAENLDQLNAAGYHAAFAGISPAMYGAVVATGIEQSQSQSTSLVQFLNSRRLGQSPLGEDGKEWEAWALSTGVYSPGSMSSLDGSEFTSGNFLSGIEHRIDSTFTAGIFASTGDSRGEFAGSSLIKQDRFTFGGYATARRDGYYATTALGGGALEAHVTRDIEFAGLSREAHSHTDGTEFFSLLAGGYDFRQSNWTFGPTASLQYSKARYDDVKEKGAGALGLAVGNPEDDSLRSLIGGRVAYHHKASETLTLVPEARVSWQHEIFRNNGTLDASLQQGAGPGFSHQLADSDGDSVAAGLALGFQTLIGFYGNVSYDIEIGRESEVNQTLSVGADWKF